MQGTPRKITQAILYEGIGIACVAPILSLGFEQGLAYTTALSVVISLIAMSWNMLFNLAFERWEQRQPQPTRTLGRRLLHSLVFEGGLSIILLPVIALWLHIDLLTALVTDLGLFGFFFCYSLLFQWLFDRVFDLPQASKPLRSTAQSAAAQCRESL
jgi:uncharacterized membrane protein